MSVAFKKSRFASTCFLLALIGLACGLHTFLPPDPLWRLDGCGNIFTVADRPMFFAWQAATPTGPWSAILHDVRTGEPIRTFFADLKQQGTLTVSPDGLWGECVDPHTGTILIAALPDGAERTISLAAGDSWRNNYLSPDGNLLAVDLNSIKNGLDHHRTVLIETESGKQVAETPGLIHRGAQFTRDGTLFVANLFDADNEFLKVWDIRKREWVFQIEGNRISKRSDSTISPDGRTLVEKYRSDENEHGWAVWDLQRFTREIVGNKGARLHQWSFSGDGRRLALLHVKGDQWHVDVWDVDAGRYVLRLASERRGEIVISPNGKRLVLQSTEPGGDPVKCLALFDLDTGRRLWEKQTWAHMFWNEPAPVFGPGGRSVVVYRGFRQPFRAEIHDTETDTLLASLPLAPDGGWTDASITVNPGQRTHTVAVARMAPPPAWLPEWATKLLGLEDGGFHESVVIDVDKRQVRARHRHREAGQSMVLDDGRFLLTIVPNEGTKSGHVCCWELPARPTWRYVIGIPTGLGGLVVAAVMLRNRRGRGVVV